MAAAGGTTGGDGGGSHRGHGEGSYLAMQPQAAAGLDRSKLPVSIEDAIEEVKVGRTQWVLLVICGLTFMSDAAEVTFLSFVTEQLRCEWGLTSAQETSITQAVFVGMILGAPIWGWVADKVGRRSAFLVSSAIICAFGFGTALTQGFYSLIAVRAIVGFGVAGLPVGFDILAEALPTSGRGAFLLYIEYFWTLGSIFVNVCAWLVLETRGWQLFTMLAALPTLVASIAGYISLPESPRWLVEEGREQEALKIVNQWAKANGSKRRFHALSVEPHAEGGGISEMCTRKKLRRTTILMCIVWFAFGLAYYGVVSLLPRIFKDQAAEATLPSNTTVAMRNGTATEFTNATARLLGEKGSCSIEFNFKDISISSAAEILGVVFAVFMIDSVGRTWTQGVFYILGAGTAVILGFRHIDLNILTVAASAARLAFMAASCATWVHTPELFPTRVRAQAHTVLNLVSKVGAFFAQYLISDTFSQVACGGMMAGISFAAGIAAVFLTETAGKDLSEMSDVGSTEAGSNVDASDSEEDGADDFLDPRE